MKWIIAAKRKCIVFLALSLLFFSRPVVYAYASNGIGITDEFDELSGDAKYLGSEYRNNYTLDIEKLGITEAAEKILNSIANVVFNMISFIGFLTVAIFYYAMDFDLAALLSPQITAIQSALRESVFLPLFQIALVGAIILAIGKYAKRDFMGLTGQLGKVIFIMVLSLLVVRDSATFMTYATAITKSVSVSILTGVSGTNVESQMDDYSSQAAGVLWVGLVHEPWKSLEFGTYAYDEDDVDFFLTASDDEKESRIKSIQNDDEKAFSKGQSATRIGQGIIILITMIVKCGVYIIAGMMFLVFQVIAVFFVLMSPIILILALMPGYDFEILSIWAKKILETQIGILIITFVIGLMVMMDLLLQDLAKEMGWFVVLIIQIAVCIALYTMRWKILLAFSTVQRAVQNPRITKRRIRMAGNPYTAAERYFVRSQLQKTFGVNNRTRRTQQNNDRDTIYDNSQSMLENQYSPRINRPTRRPVTDMPATEYERINANRIPQSRAAYSERTYSADSGILGETYYAPRDVTDNWRDIWNNSTAQSRPSTTDGRRENIYKSVLSERTGKALVKTPRIAKNRVLREQTKVSTQSSKESLNTANRAPLLDTDKTKISGNGSLRQKGSETKVIRPVTMQSGGKMALRDNASRGVSGNRSARPVTSTPAASGTTPGSGSRLTVGRAAENQAARPVTSTPAASGTTPGSGSRLTVGRAAENQAARPVTSTPAASGTTPGSGSRLTVGRAAENQAARPVTSTHAASGTTPGSGSRLTGGRAEENQAARPVTSTHAASGTTPGSGSRLTVGRAAENQAARSITSTPAASGFAPGPEKRLTVGRAAENQAARPATSTPAASGTTPGSGSRLTGGRAAENQVARPVMGAPAVSGSAQESEGGRQPTKNSANTDKVSKRLNKRSQRKNRRKESL